MRWCVVIFLLGFPGAAVAGVNRTGQACLSWSARDVVTANDVAQSSFPVYVHVDGAADIRALSVWLRWYPNSYELVNAPPSTEPGVGCNVTTPPLASFGDDVTYDATIVFATPPGDHAVIAYWFKYTGKEDPPPATFCLREVKAMDGAGSIDPLGLMEGLSLAGGAVPGGCPPTETTVARGRLLARLREEALSTTGTRASASPRDVLAATEVADSLSAAGVLTMRRVSPFHSESRARARNLIGEPIMLPRPSAVYAIQLRPEAIVGRVAKELSENSAVEFVSPVPATTLYHVPQDPLFKRQWALDNALQAYGCALPPFNPGTDIHLPAALDLASERGDGVRIGVLDTGVQSDHPELAGRVETGFNAAADLYFLDWATEDSASHGTAVAGISAASADNGIGMAGIAGNATVVPVRMNGGGAGWPYVVTATACVADYGIWGDAPLNGLWWAVDSTPAAPILNMSWGNISPDSWYPWLAEPCLVGLLNGQFLVAASGNDNWDDPQWVPAPARYAKRVFSVGAVFGNGLRWDDRILPQPPDGWGRGLGPPSWLPMGSNWGPHLTAVAPGGHMIASLRMYTLADTSAGPGNWRLDCAHEYFAVDSCNVSFAVIDSVEFGGTSAAAPTVSGVAALLLGEHPGELLGEDIWQVLVRTAVNPRTGAPSAGRSDTLGAGMIRADRALEFLAPPKVIYHPRATGLTTAAMDTVEIAFQGGTPDIPDGTYDAVRFRRVGRATFTTPLQLGSLETWVRASGTAGILDADTYDYVQDVPLGRITSADTAGVNVETWVYKVLSGGSLLTWYPCDTTEAAVATTVVGYPTTVTGVEDAVVERFSLTVSPTPARGSAMLTLFAAGPAIVDVTIFDVQGRVVRHLGRRSVAGGAAHFLWDGRRDDGSHAADGVYYALGRANLRSRVARIVLLH